MRPYARFCIASFRYSATPPPPSPRMRPRQPYLSRIRVPLYSFTNLYSSVYSRMSRVSYFFSASYVAFVWCVCVCFWCLYVHVFVWPFKSGLQPGSLNVYKRVCVCVCACIGVGTYTNVYIHTETGTHTHTSPPKSTRGRERDSRRFVCQDCTCVKMQYHVHKY